MDTLTTNERALRAREGKRIVDIVLGHADNRTQVCHYLVIERLDPERFYAPDVREIEQYRDAERVKAVALDCETGERDAKCLGAFTLTYQDGKVVGAAVLDLTADLMDVHPDRARNILVEGDQ